ncbi:MAG: hypothetical protein RL150_658 [Candidatus Parcubacteria bacterium]|jgi:hypothetical protein
MSGFKNIGTGDRVVRVVLAGALLLLAFLIDIEVIAYVVLAASLFTFMQGVVGWCALYALLGVNTCPVSVQKK